MTAMQWVQSPPSRAQGAGQRVWGWQRVPDLTECRVLTWRTVGVVASAPLPVRVLYMSYICAQLHLTLNVRCPNGAKSCQGA